MSGSLEARLSYLRARVMIGRGKWCSVIVVENNIPFAINQRQPDPFGRRTDFFGRRINADVLHLLCNPQIIGLQSGIEQLPLEFPLSAILKHEKYDDKKPAHHQQRQQDAPMERDSNSSIHIHSLSETQDMSRSCRVWIGCASRAHPPTDPSPQFLRAISCALVPRV